MDGTIGTNGYVANEMYDRINYGRGGSGLAYGNSVLAANAHADGTATNANLGNLATQVQFGFDNSLEVARESRNIDQFGRVTDNQFRAELRGSDQLNVLSKEVADNARVTDKCCCETKEELFKGFATTQLEASKNQGALLLKMCEDKNDLSKQISEQSALILAVEGRANLDKLAEARAKITQLETISALDHGHHRGWVKWLVSTT